MKVRVAIAALLALSAGVGLSSPPWQSAASRVVWLGPSRGTWPITVCWGDRRLHRGTRVSTSTRSEKQRGITAPTLISAVSTAALMTRNEPAVDRGGQAAGLGDSEQ